MWLNKFSPSKNKTGDTAENDYNFDIVEEFVIEEPVTQENKQIKESVHEIESLMMSEVFSIQHLLKEPTLTSGLLGNVNDSTTRPCAH